MQLNNSGFCLKFLQEKIIYIYAYVLFWEAVVPHNLQGLVPDRSVHVLQINFSKTERTAGAYQVKEGKKNTCCFIKKETEKIITPEVRHYSTSIDTEY